MGSGLNQTADPRKQGGLMSAGGAAMQVTAAGLWAWESRALEQGAATSQGRTRGREKAGGPDSNPNRSRGRAWGNQRAAVQGTHGAAEQPDHPSRPLPPPPTSQRKGKGTGEGKIGQGGRGRTWGGERTTAYRGKGSKGRAVSGDRSMGPASCRPKRMMASCQPPPPRHPPRVFLNPPPSPPTPPGGGGGGSQPSPPIHGCRRPSSKGGTRTYTEKHQPAHSLCPDGNPPAHPRHPRVRVPAPGSADPQSACPMAGEQPGSYHRDVFHGC